MPRSEIEEEIARVIDKAFDDWQGEESEAAFVTARLSPLLNRVRAEAWGEGAEKGYDDAGGNEHWVQPWNRPDYRGENNPYVEQNSEGNET